MLLAEHQHWLKKSEPYQKYPIFSQLSTFPWTIFRGNSLFHQNGQTQLALTKNYSQGSVHLHGSTLTLLPSPQPRPGPTDHIGSPLSMWPNHLVFTKMNIWISRMWSCHSIFSFFFFFPPSHPPSLLFFLFFNKHLEATLWVIFRVITSFTATCMVNTVHPRTTRVWRSSLPVSLTEPPRRPFAAGFWFSRAPFLFSSTAWHLVIFFRVG